jgi:hypothetical protein
MNRAALLAGQEVPGGTKNKRRCKAGQTDGDMVGKESGKQESRCYWQKKKKSWLKVVWGLIFYRRRRALYTGAGNIRQGAGVVQSVSGMVR